MKLRFLLLLSSLLIVLPAFAVQDDGSDDDSGAVTKAAYLNVAYDQHGGARVDFSLPQQPASWTGIQQALSQMLNCPAGRIHPNADPRSYLYLNRLPEAERERLNEVADEDTRELHGQCRASAHRNGLELAATLDTNNLVTELRSAGIEKLGLSIEAPELPYVAFSGAPNRPTKTKNPLLGKLAQEATFVPIQISEKTDRPIIRVSYGWSKAAAARTLIRMMVFLLLPVAILLRVRALSLKTFKDDPTGAWFAYMKTLGWCTNGGMLLWYLTNLGARKDIESLLDFIVANGYRSTAVNLATYFVPAAFIYLTCISISHRVFVDVKKAQYTWAQFLAEHAISLARTIVPIACISAAIGFYSQPQMITTLMFVGFGAAILLGRWRLKLTKNYPQIVMAGELRDRVFGFAKTLGVKLQQVIILPAQRMQMANAFASQGNTVIFTDFLLERMSKREVDAIAGHELTHLKRSHPAKLGMAMVAACFAPVWMTGLPTIAFALLFRAGLKLPPQTLMNIYSVIGKLSDWGIDGAIAVAVAFAGVYALSRRFERQADAGAVALTNDPEAAITALLKLNSLNLMPLSWGKGTGASLTHPSTLKRVQRIATKAGMPEAQLEQLIAQFSVEKLSHVEVETAAEEHKEGEHYASKSGDGAVSQKAVTRSQNLLFLFIALLVVPPAVIEFAVEHLHLAYQLGIVVLGIGIVLTTAIYFLTMKMLPLRSLAKKKASRLQTIERSGVKITDLESCLVGFAPGPAPRIYVGDYNFDIGALVLSKDRLTYLGRQLKFSLTRRQVLSIQTGPGIPSWWPQPRIYIRWQDDAKGTVEVFSLSGQEPCSLWQLDSRMQELYSKLLNWRLRGQPQQLPLELETLTAPQIGEVTCKTPRETLSLKIQFTVFLLAGAGIWGISSLMGIRSGYLWLTLIIMRIFEILPYLFYREPKQEKLPTPVVAKAAAATASA